MLLRRRASQRKGFRGANRKHEVHVCHARRVEAQWLVERRRELCEDTGERTICEPYIAAWLCNR